MVIMVAPPCLKIFAFKGIKGLYHAPRLAVKINNEVFDAMGYKRVVCQGCPASLMLFEIYINDIFNGMAGVSVPGLDDKISGLLFADNAVILAESADELQKSYIS
ncbi:hypothetical protein BB561_000234 [Smittium simulii]|uniref:Uncharacterized protein n=1 Tax=Smittium simulii TaxID=133385 RepID=A0A2T9YZP9_9FUNG|nr:hypothetical protein BB561_000234 [Smittium simulii]